MGGGVGGLADRALKQGGLADRAKNRDSGAAGAGNGTSSTENSTKATTENTGVTGVGLCIFSGLNPIRHTFIAHHTEFSCRNGLAD